MGQELHSSSSSKKKKMVEISPAKTDSVKVSNAKNKIGENNGKNLSEFTKRTIATLAFDISRENQPYNVCIWHYAELHLHLIHGKLPSEAEKRDMASKLASQKKSLQDLHWGIAEMQIQLQRLK